MESQKYAALLKPLKFTRDGANGFEQEVTMGKADHGLNVHVRYGTFAGPGPISTEGMHTHDFDQLILWLGSDPRDLLELGADIEVRLGIEREIQLFNVPAALAVPKGLPHFPATIRKMNKKFQYMEISLAPEYSSTALAIDPSIPEAQVVSGFRAKYAKYLKRLQFVKKGPYFYGANNPENSGGTFTSITGDQSGLPLHISYESIEKAPYTFGPVPHTPHVHKFEEILLFMGADCDHLNYLGGMAECSMGRENEILKLNGPAAIICPEMLPHAPLTVTSVEKPFMFMVISCAAHHH